MKYMYFPNSYDENLKMSKFKDDNEFLSAQIQYKMMFEKIIDSYITSSKIDASINSYNIDIPVVDDRIYNFYHRYSKLQSKYVYVRNNYHVENLSQEEIDLLLHQEEITKDFFDKTLERVLFENGDKTFFGPAVDSNLVKSKSIVFEFAYDQKKCTSVEQLITIENVIYRVSQYIENCLKSKINIPVSFITYKAIPDIYYKEENDLRLLL